MLAYINIGIARAKDQIHLILHQNWDIITHGTLLKQGVKNASKNGKRYSNLVAFPLRPFTVFKVLPNFSSFSYVCPNLDSVFCNSLFFNQTIWAE